MSVTPLEIARHIEWQRRPWWTVWYGRKTGHYWAIAMWVPGRAGVLEAPTPDLLVAAITNFELLHPKPPIDPSESMAVAHSHRSIPP
jgi:hypothetical protein